MNSKTEAKRIHSDIGVHGSMEEEEAVLKKRIALGTRVKEESANLQDDDTEVILDKILLS